MARIPVSGVRTSCANAASAASTMPGAAGSAARLGTLAAVTAGARFCSGRLFGGRPVRGERDFDAMIPLTLARLQHAMAGLRESRRTGFSPLMIGFWQSRRIRAGRPAAGYRPGSRPGARSSRRPVAADRFRKFSPRVVADQRVMPVAGLRQAEQALQQPVDAGRPEQVLAAHHVGHALQGVVDHDREMIAGRRFLASEDDVSPGFRPGGHRTGLAGGAFAEFEPVEFAGLRGGRRHVEPQRVRHAPIRAAGPARRTTAVSPHPDRAARRRGRAAKSAAPPAPPPVLRFRRGSRKPDRPGPGR